MKNPFLQERNIFSKVQKPITKLSKDDKSPQDISDKIPSYESKYAPKPQTKPLNSMSMNPRTANQMPSTYQRQQAIYTSSQANIPTKKYSTQKITFGDPMSSQAYQGDRTSGYFNMMGNHQQQNAVKQAPQNKYDNLKYEPKKNNFFQADNKQTTKESYQTYDMKQTRKQLGKYGNYGNKNDDLKMDYEFSPPPINNFTTTQPMEYNKNQFQGNNYEYKPSYGANHNRPSYQTNEQQPYQPQKQPFTNDSNFMNKKNPFTSNSYKSPPKQYDGLITPKNDISQRFKDNNYAELSPIGQVSRHRINQDSIMNLDGIMDGLELDKLLAESKTQEELIKILGMDGSMIKKPHDSGNKYQGEYDFKGNKYENIHTAANNAYSSNFNPTLNQQNQWSKKAFQPQKLSQQTRFQTFKDEEQEPQVFNYGQTSIKSPPQTIKPTANYQPQSHRQSPPKFTKPSTSTHRQPQKITYHYSQIPDKRTMRNNQIPNKQDDYDLEKIMQKQMEKFMCEKEGFSKDRRVFLTANQKIVTKKYQLQPL